MMRRKWVRNAGLWALALIALPASVFSDATFDKLIAAKNYKEALDYADEKIATTDRDANVWMKLAQANDALGMTEKALACYLVSWRMNPNDYQSLLGAAQVYNKLNQPDNAMNMAQKALDQNFTAEASWEFARACIALGKPADAKKALEKVLEADPSNIVANRELGNIYYDEGLYSQAVPLMKRAYKDKSNGEVAFKIGKSYTEIGIADSAMAYLKDAVAKKVNLSEASLYIARASYGLKKYSDALEGYETVAKDQMTAMDYYMVAVSKEQTKNASGAADAYEAAVKAFGNEKAKEALLAREKVARDQMGKKAYAAAIPHLQFIVGADEKGAVVPDIYFLLADAYMSTDNSAQAISSLEKAIALNSRNIEAYARLADLYEKSNQSEKAKKTYEAMMSLSPNDPNVFLALGNYNLKAKRYSEALGHFEKSNGLKKSAAASEGIAVASYNSGNMPKALDAAKGAIALDPNTWEARVILANVLIKDKNYKSAQEQVEFLVKKEPGNADYLDMLAACYEQNGEKDKLAEIDRKIVALDRKNINARLRLARYADTKNDVETALTMYKEASVLDPKNAEAFRRLSDLSLKKNEKSDAVDYMKKYLALTPDDAIGQRDLGDMLYEKKDFDAAQSAYETAIKIDPNLKGFHKRYAEIVIAKGQQDKVITALSTLIKNGEADFGTYTTLGMIYQKKKQHKSAIEMYSKALQLDPQNLDALTALGSSQAATGDLNAAIISYEQAVMMNPDAGPEYKELGDLYNKQKKSEEATKAYMKYLDKVPSDKEVAYSVGKLSFQNKQYAEAAKYLALAKSSDPAFLLMYAEACLNSGNTKEAIASLDEIKNRKTKVSNIAEVLKLLGEAYEKSGNVKQAAATYTEYVAQKGVKDADAAYKAAFLQEKTDPAAAIRIYDSNTRTYPSDFRNILRLGLLYSENKETLSKALPLLKKCTSIADSLPMVWLELAQVYGKLGKDDDELDAYQKYAKTDPQHLESNKRIGTLLMRKGDFTNAMVFLEIANTISPDDASVMTLLAKGYLRTNRSKEAIDLLVKAKSAKPDDADIRFQLFELYQQTGQTQKAQEEIKSLVELKKDSKYLLLYGEALIAQNKVKDADAVVEDILSNDPENIDALMLKGKVLRARRKWDDALEIYKMVTEILPEFAQGHYERAETYMQASKPTWAETFYKRALRSDPQFALAELGLAKLYKSRKNNELYKQHLEAARKLAPDNDEVLEELKKAK